MLEWLLGRKDTAESLTREVNSFFDTFRRLQARIEALVLTNKEAEVRERDLNVDIHRKLVTTLDNALARANKVYGESYAGEQERHEKVTEELVVEMKALRAPLRLATKVVNFAVEE